MLIAGEPSGDVLGARLISALNKELDGAVKFSGVGGENMVAQGLRSLFPMEELSVMGFAEVVPRIPMLLRRIRETVRAVISAKPDVLVTIDSPGFALRVAGRLKGQGIPLVHYVAPQVWAWRPGRAKKIARTFDRLLALLPFEPPYFEREGLTCDFVGHSVIEDVMDVEEARKRRNDFRKAHGIAADGPLLVVLPGSRKSEVDRMLAIFLEAANQASRRIPGLHVVVPTLPQIEERVRGGVQGAKIPITVVATHDEKLSAFAAADGALAASGTVSLELAAAQVPTLIAYKLNPISAWIGRRVIQVPWITLTNIILNQPLIPEEIQENCRPDRLAEGIYSLLKDEKMRAEQRLGSNEVLRKLGLGDDRQPSYRAARAVISVIASRS